MPLSRASAIAFIITTDRQRSEAFYTKTLGLPRLKGDDFAAVFALGDAMLRITEVPGYSAGPHPALGWKVDDIAATMRALKANGVSFTIYEGFGQDAEGVWTSPDGGAKIAWFTDPDGNVLSLTES